MNGITETTFASISKIVKSDNFVPPPKSQLNLFLRVARQHNCTDYIHDLARSIDDGRVLFTDSRSSLTTDSDDGEYLCSFLNEVYATRYEASELSSSERSIRRASSALLIFVSGRAIRSSWFRNVNYKAIKGTIVLRPLPFGNEYDLALLVFTWIEWNRPFTNHPQTIASLVLDLFAVYVDKSYLVLIATELAKQSMCKSHIRAQYGADVFCSSLRLSRKQYVENGPVSTAFLESLNDDLNVLLAKCWGYAMAIKLRRPPERGTFVSSRLYLQNNKVYEFNEYVGGYRLIALPPSGIQMSDPVRYDVDGENVFLIHNPTNKVYRLNLLSVKAPDTPENNFQERHPYPCNEWESLSREKSRVLLKGKTASANDIVFQDGDNYVTITTDSQRLNEWRVSWKKHFSPEAVRFSVSFPIKQYCSHVYAVLNGSHLTVVGAAHHQQSLIDVDVEYVLDLISRQFHTTSKAKRRTANVFQNRNPKSSWSSGTPVVLDRLPTRPVPLCIGEFRVPSSREGFWVCDDPDRTPVEKVDGLNWRKTGRFSLSDLRSTKKSQGVDVDPEGNTLAAVNTIRCCGPFNEQESSMDIIEHVTESFESMHFTS